METFLNAVQFIGILIVLWLVAMIILPVIDNIVAIGFIICCILGLYMIVRRLIVKTNDSIERRKKKKK